MTEDAQIRVRLIVDDQARPNSALARNRQRATGTGGSVSTPAGERTAGEQAQREGRQQKDREKTPTKDSGITELPKRMAGFARSQLFRGGGEGAAATQGALQSVGRTVGSVVPFAGAAIMGTAATLGAVEFTRTMVPIINAAVAEMVGVEDSPIFDMISSRISDVFNTVGSVLPVAGETMNLARTVALAGGNISAGQLGSQYSMRLALMRETKGLRDDFNREINQDVARSLVRMAMGREGD